MTLAVSLAMALPLFSASPCPSAQLPSFRASPTALSLLLVSLKSTGSILVSSIPAQDLLFPILPVWLKASWQGPPTTLSSSSSRPSHTAPTPLYTTGSLFLTITILHPLPLPWPPFLLLARAPVAATSLLLCLFCPFPPSNLFLKLPPLL